MAFEIKDEFKDTVVGFNNSKLPLGQRDDLHLLAEVALKQNGEVKDAHIMNMFKSVPTLDDIKTAKEAAFNKKQAAKQPVPTVNQAPAAAATVAK